MNDILLFQVHAVGFEFWLENEKCSSEMIFQLNSVSFELCIVSSL